MKRSTMTTAPSGFFRFGLTLLAVGTLLIGSNWLRTHLEAQAWSAISALDDEKTPDLRFVMEIQHPIDAFSPDGASAALPPTANRTCARSRLRTAERESEGGHGVAPAPAPADSASPTLPSSNELLPAPLPAPRPRTPVFDI